MGLTLYKLHVLTNIINNTIIQAGGGNMQEKSGDESMQERFSMYMEDIVQKIKNFFEEIALVSGFLLLLLLTISGWDAETISIRLAASPAKAKGTIYVLMALVAFFGVTRFFLFLKRREIVDAIISTIFTLATTIGFMTGHNPVSVTEDIMASNMVQESFFAFFVILGIALAVWIIISLYKRTQYGWST